ncbi:MAG: voltage-gated potassium channel [Saprospiraceae bacterium]|jgi:voltage-gated potassium channel
MKFLNLGHRLPSGFMSIRIAIGLVLFVVLLGVIGFMALEAYTLTEAFYMTIITISTVGFTEVRPLHTQGQLFASFLIILNIGVFAYALAVFSYFIVEGKFFKNIFTAMINQQISELENHVIVCGYGRYGREISEHFFAHNQPFVVIEADSDKIEMIRQSEEKILYIEADATTDEALIAAGIKKAGCFITALPGDADNVFTVLSARQLNPNLNIISRSIDSKSVAKLELAGANHVITPERIGGFYMAMLVSKPGAIEFFSFLTSKYEGDINFEEIAFKDLPEKMRNKAIKDLHLRQNSGANIIGYRNGEGKYTVNPSPEAILTPGTSFIVLGDGSQLSKMKKYFGIK